MEEAVTLCTRSRSIRSAVRRVLQQMPKADRRALESVVAQIRCKREWSESGLFGEGGIDETAGATLPLFGDFTSSPDRCRVQIVFCLHVFRMFTGRARRAIVAHEF